MNYLAHLFLSCDHPERMVGNFLTDYLTLEEAQTYKNGFLQGIQLHKLIDTFTDQHRSVREATRFLSTSQGKYAPVVIDIYFDYLLSISWKLYTDESFEHFSKDVYAILLKYLSVMPQRIQPRVRKMVEANWLESYRHRTGLEYTFSRLEKRVRFKNNLKNATEHLFLHLNTYQKYFSDFFPDVLVEVRRFCDC